MYIQLMHRHYGVHKAIKHIEIPCDFKDIYLGDGRINEELLLKSIQEGWLPRKPKQILLAVANENGSTGQYNLNYFMPWSKYFDSYVLELHEKPEDWWDDKMSV